MYAAKPIQKTKRFLAFIHFRFLDVRISRHFLVHHFKSCIQNKSFSWTHKHLERRHFSVGINLLDFCWFPVCRGCSLSWFQPFQPFQQAVSDAGDSPAFLAVGVLTDVVVFDTYFTEWCLKCYCSKQEVNILLPKNSIFGFNTNRI